ncbi:MAG TPA: histidinol dehydrogenase, partial [Actinomycetota bacterium]|nr:histidinol dehydrogenase [Actinomycetota bacterium]
MTTLQPTDLRRGGTVAPVRPDPVPPNVTATVRDVVERVRSRGDRALLELTRRFDGVELTPDRLFVSTEEIEDVANEIPNGLRAAIDAMIERLRDLHARQLPAEWQQERDGLRVGEIVRPVHRAGCYVPGGRAAYPSTAAMTVVPAAVAGVEEIVVATPPRRDGSVSPAVRYAATAAGAHRILRVGGAQAVAALAFGTETVPAVDVIVGPGNVYVTAAK